jgi:hypothetical protein
VSSPAALERALEEAARALERGDTPKAAAAMGAASQCCADADQQGLRLDPAGLARVRSLWERCGRACATAQQRLEASLLHFGTSRRAFGAYRRR